MGNKSKNGHQGEGGGRPSPYAGREIKIAQQIAARLQTGEPLASILRENNMPSHDAIEDWRSTIPEVERIIARARIIGYDVIAADCLAIADDKSGDAIETEHGEIPNGEFIQRSKVRIETRLKLLAKWDPKRYGDSPQTVLNNTVTTTTQVNVMTEEKLKQISEKKRIAIEQRQADRHRALGNG